MIRWVEDISCTISIVCSCFAAIVVVDVVYNVIACMYLFGFVGQVVSVQRASRGLRGDYDFYWRKLQRGTAIDLTVSVHSMYCKPVLCG